MWPLTALSIFVLAGIIERCLFWFNLLRQETKTTKNILTIAHQDLAIAADYAKAANKTPVGRFLHAPLALENPDPDLFRLALESAADEELSNMMRGEKLLEAAITLAPLLGLLGTVTGLIISFSSLKVGDTVANAKTGNIAQGIGEALITTASGLIVAIIASGFHRLFLAFHAGQVKLFTKAGNELELLYRQAWQRQQKNEKSESIG
ncbi:MotA/TolQ/ExbB proton channel family protein [Tumidithrix helvetica]|uniref:MotA/TolQ/ExbB proton channel family protein n=1 Tax=Tumidithrix helvetica TaxID=3457545 RepID=UPI003CC517A1